MVILSGSLEYFTWKKKIQNKITVSAFEGAEMQKQTEFPTGGREKEKIEGKEVRRITMAADGASASVKGLRFCLDAEEASSCGTCDFINKWNETLVITRPLIC